MGLSFLWEMWGYQVLLEAMSCFWTVRGWENMAESPNTTLALWSPPRRETVKEKRSGGSCGLHAWFLSTNPRNWFWQWDPSSGEELGLRQGKWLTQDHLVHWGPRKNVNPGERDSDSGRAKTWSQAARFPPAALTITMELYILPWASRIPRTEKWTLRWGPTHWWGLGGGALECRTPGAARPSGGSSLRV